MDEANVLNYVQYSLSAKVAPNWHLFQAEVLLLAAVVAPQLEDLARLPKRPRRKRKKRRRRSLMMTWDSGFSTKLLADKTMWSKRITTVCSFDVTSTPRTVLAEQSNLYLCGCPSGC